MLCGWRGGVGWGEGRKGQQRWGIQAGVRNQLDDSTQFKTNATQGPFLIQLAIFGLATVGGKSLSQNLCHVQGLSSRCHPEACTVVFPHDSVGMA